MKNNSPLISVIMNCFNGEKFLKEAIDSIYKQTYNNWEIIFWDNNSKDKSRSIAKKYNKKLHYFKSKTTTILGEARVKAVNESSGDLLAFLDCDDVWLSDKLEKQVKVYRNNVNAGIIYSKANIINTNGEIIGLMPDKLKLPTGDIFSELVKDNFIPFVSALVSREKYYQCGGFPLNFVNATDYNLFLKISFNYKAIGLNDITCMYRQHDNNLSNKTKIIGAKENLEIVGSFLPNSHAKKGMTYQRVSLICAYIKELKFFKAILLLIKNPDTIFIFIKRINKKLY